MSDVEGLWRRRSDDEVAEAARRIEEYTAEGQDVIRAEIRHRGIAAPSPTPPCGLESVEYSSALGRAQWASGLLIVGAVLDVVAVASTAGEVSLLTTVVAGGTISETTAAASDARQQLIGWLQILVLAVTVVAFLRWLSRSYKNLPALGVVQPRFTPGWAIGAWFVPFLNLVRPYQIVKELWIAGGSTQRAPRFSSEATAPSSALLGWWWATWLVSGFIAQAAFRLSIRAEAPGELLVLSYLTLTSDAVGIIAAVLAVYLVRGIADRQESMWQATNGPNTAMESTART